MLNLILLGPPGAGKGTQAVRLTEKFNIKHISTGSIFRKNIKAGTPLGKTAKEHIDRGELVPDDVTIEITKGRILEDDCKEGFLLDGFPRTVYQAVALSEFVMASGRKIDLVIDIVVDMDELIARLAGRRVCKLCGATYHIERMRSKKDGICDRCGGELFQRSDDNGETVANRIEIYNREIKPIIDYYETIGNIVHIDGAIGLENVFDEILKAIEA